MSSLSAAAPTELGLEDRASPLDETAPALFADELVLLDDDLATREHYGRLALHLATLIGVVVDAHVMSLRRDRGGRPRIPDDDVGVAAHRDRALLREHAHDLRGRGRRDLDPAIQRDPLLHDTAVVEQHHARLDTRRPVRDLREVADPELLLFGQSLEAFGHAEGTVVSRDDLKVVPGKSLPELLLVPPLAKWRAHDVFRAVEARLVVVVDREEEVLRARLGVRGQATVAEETNLLERLRRREMDDVQRDLAG